MIQSGDHHHILVTGTLLTLNLGFRRTGSCWSPLIRSLLPGDTVSSTISAPAQPSGDDSHCFIQKLALVGQVNGWV